MIDWKTYFDNLVLEESEEHRMVGLSSKESQLTKFHAVLNLIPEAGDYSLLDIGCGTGVFEELLLKHYPSLRIKAIDVSKEQLRMARDKDLEVEFEFGSILDIPYPDSSFDIVTCIGVLQNFNGSLSNAITEMKRVLTKGGVIFLVTMDSECVDIKSGKINKNPLNTYYVPEELGEMLEHNGFIIERMDAISTNEVGVVLPLHQWHTFLISGRKT